MKYFRAIVVTRRNGKGHIDAVRLSDDYYPDERTAAEYEDDVVGLDRSKVEVFEYDDESVISIRSMNHVTGPGFLRDLERRQNKDFKKQIQDIERRYRLDEDG